MIGILITYVCGIATGATGTVIFACLIDIADRRRREAKKKGIFEP
jgi:hypothetical protein